MIEVALRLSKPDDSEIEQATHFVRVYVVDHDDTAIATIELSEDFEQLGGRDDLAINISLYRDVGVDTHIGRVVSSVWAASVEQQAALLLQERGS